MDRRDLLLTLFDSSGFGLEVGPSYNPFLPKREGYNVETVDYASADVLREKYRPDSDIDISRIEDPTYISDGQGLLDLIGKPGRYDFIFASHVIEHVTDFIRFIKDCEALLKNDGKLVLAVPDKRYCFDVLRPLTTAGEVLQAFHEKRQRHPPGMIFDYQLSVAHKRNVITWLEPNFDEIHHLNTPKEAFSSFEEAQKRVAYWDIHAWKFTPSSFRYLVKTLRSLGLIQSGEDAIRINTIDDGRFMHEFYVVLSKTAPDLTVSDMDLIKAAERELREISVDSQSELSQLRHELAIEKAKNESLLNSTSWKITRPLRAFKKARG